MLALWKLGLASFGSRRIVVLGYLVFAVGRLVLYFSVSGSETTIYLFTVHSY